MQKTQLSLKAQIGLVLGVLTFFSAAVAFAGYMGAHQASAKMAAFASDGVTTTGRITDKYIHVVTRVWVYWLDVEFKTGDGVVHHVSENVANSIYDNLDIGRPVQVTYVRSNPQWFYVAGTAPRERDVGISSVMFQVGSVSAVICLFSTLGLVLWGDGAGNGPAPEAPGAAAVRRASGGPRTTFGVRRG
ncbi:MAG: hypothetical protein ABSD74_12850 [Rhizomicrobium sp.]